MVRAGNPRLLVESGKSRDEEHAGLETPAASVRVNSSRSASSIVPLRNSRTPEKARKRENGSGTVQGDITVYRKA